MTGPNFRTAATVLGIMLVMLCSGQITRAAEPITPDQLARLRAEIPPAPSEQKWTQIPWQTSLWAARQQAAKEGKPILLWEMDGHPLGCV